MQKSIVSSFNPYFVGCYSGSDHPVKVLNRYVLVSILILLDVILEVHITYKSESDVYVVSILILLDVILEAGIQRHCLPILI